MLRISIFKGRYFYGISLVIKNPVEIPLSSNLRPSCSEAATKAIFWDICSFLPGAFFLNFSRRLHMFTEQILNFPGGDVCSPNKYYFSRRICLLAEQIPFFQEPFSCDHQTDTNFPGEPFWLPNKYRFSRSTVFAFSLPNRYLLRFCLKYSNRYSLFFLYPFYFP